MILLDVVVFLLGSVVLYVFGESLKSEERAVIGALFQWISLLALMVVVVGVVTNKTA